MSLCLLFCLCLPICLTDCLLDCLSFCLSVCISVCLSVSLSICLSVCLYLCRSVCLPACFSPLACLYVFLLISFSFCLLTVYIFFTLPFCFPVCSSIILFIYPSLLCSFLHLYSPFVPFMYLPLYPLLPLSVCKFLTIFPLICSYRVYLRHAACFSQHLPFLSFSARLALYHTRCFALLSVPSVPSALLTFHLLHIRPMVRCKFRLMSYRSTVLGQIFNAHVER